MNYTKATFILSLFLGVLFECRAQSTDTIYQSVTVQQFDSLTHVTPNAVIVDVRSPVDYVEAYIPNAVNIDYTGKYWLQVVEHMDKEPTYFLYCLDGEIAPVAAEYMHLQGVKHIYVLDTGLEGWIQAKMPTAKHDVDLRSRQ